MMAHSESLNLRLAFCWGGKRGIGAVALDPEDWMFFHYWVVVSQ